MNERWWLVEGAIVEDKNGQLHFYYPELLISVTSSGYLYKAEELIPRGVPFDCMPEWAEEISFRLDGWYSWNREALHHCFNNCPEEWKGKTLPITNELKKLIGLI